MTNLRVKRSPVTSRGTACRLTTSLALALLAIAGCERADSQPEGPPPPPDVSTVTINPRNLPVVFEYTGRISGIREVEVRARVTGILRKHNYVEGARVKASDSLFTIDPMPYRPRWGAPRRTSRPPRRVATR